MLTINKTLSFQQECNTQNNQRSDLPRLQTLKQDTVSFKANEGLFLKHLRELCKDGWDGHLAGKVQAYAHSVDPKHPEVLAEFKKMKTDSTLEKGLKEWIFDDLLKSIGIGGNKRV